ncbi:unnamed protein product, partial [Cyprideis torosa]
MLCRLLLAGSPWVAGPPTERSNEKFIECIEGLLKESTGSSGSAAGPSTGDRVPPVLQPGLKKLLQTTQKLQETEKQITLLKARANKNFSKSCLLVIWEPRAREFIAASIEGDLGRMKTLHAEAEEDLRSAREPTEGKTALMFSVKEGHYRSVLWLLRELEAGVNVEKDLQSQTPLHYACAAGRPLIVSLLLREGALVEARDHSGRTPMFCAALEGLPDTLRMLHRFGANAAAADNDGKTPLHLAANCGYTSSVSCLLEMGASVEAADKKWKERPLHAACIRCHTPCVKLLLSAGADINARLRNGTTPLHLCSMEGHLPVLLLLLRQGAVVDSRDEAGNTPLFSACMKGHVYAARVLIAHGADVNTKDRMGFTPLLWASEGGHVAIVKFLVEETKVDLEGRLNISEHTALALAAREDHTQVMKILLAAGAEVDGRCSAGRTPLMYACLNGSVEGVRLLIQHGADWRLSDDYGDNAVACAFRRGDLSLREYFMSLCGRECHEFLETKTIFPKRLESEFTEIEEIGRGSFGAVVKAEKDGKPYAVKQIEDPDVPASTGEKQVELLWMKEANTMAVGKASPFICGLIRHWRQEESQIRSTFFQMELCESDLHHWMSKKKPKSRNQKKVLRFLCDCSSGLRFLHDGVKKIHRDIKPGNIFLRREADEEGTTRLVAKIGDLGLATDRSNPKGEFYFERSQGGGAGVYLAPEIKGIALKTENNPVVHGVP